MLPIFWSRVHRLGSVFIRELDCGDSSNYNLITVRLLAHWLTFILNDLDIA